MEAVTSPVCGLAPGEFANIRQSAAANQASHTQWTEDSGIVQLGEALYIHLYHGNAALLAESLEVIQKTSAVILPAIENPAAEAAEEQEPKLMHAS
jgi:hypothetical protein